MSEAQIVSDSGATVASPEAIAATAPQAGEQGDLNLTPDAAPAAAPSWRDSLDAEIREHPALTRVPDVPSLAKNYLEQGSLVGRKGIILPKDGDAADQARFRKEIGVPETVEGYELDFTPPEGLPWSEDFETAMLGKLHALGIPKGQIKQLFSDYADVQNEQYQAMQETTGQGYEQAQLKLKQELGREYEPSRALAERAFKAAAGDNFEEVSHLVLADGTHLGDNPAFVRTFINVGKQFAEHGLAGEKVGGGGFGKTPEQALQEITELEANPALWQEGHPEQKMLAAKRDELYKFAYTDKKPEVL